MGNILLGVQNFADTGYYEPLLSGGDWLAALPLANAQDKVFSKVARSADADTGSTRFHADLAVERDVRLLAVCNHNLGRSARARFRGSKRSAWSGVTLAANHGLTLPRFLTDGALPPDCAAFSARRFDVPQAA